MFFILQGKSRSQRLSLYVDWLEKAVFNAKIGILQRTTKHIALFSPLTAPYLRKITKKGRLHPLGILVCLTS
jgi:hypothetical protein